KLLADAKKATSVALSEKQRLDVQKLTAQAAMTAGQALAAEFDALISARDQSAQLEARAEEMMAEAELLEAARRAAALVDARRHLEDKVAERDELLKLLSDAEEQETIAADRQSA